jgi:hypothetical protein
MIQYLFMCLLFRDNPSDALNPDEFGTRRESTFPADARPGEAKLAVDAAPAITSPTPQKVFAFFKEIYPARIVVALQLLLSNSIADWL